MTVLDTAAREPKAGTRPIGWRLLAKMRVSDSGCWVWTGYTNQEGYGRASVNGRAEMAHRASYEYFVGPIPDGLTIDHRCRVRACINPYHLETATLRENILRGNATGAINARKTHCKNDHPLSGDNLYVGPNGRRVCRICRRAEATKRMRLWRATRAAQ